MRGDERGRRARRRRAAPRAGRAAPEPLRVCGLALTEPARDCGLAPPSETEPLRDAVGLAPSGFARTGFMIAEMDAERWRAKSLSGLSSLSAASRAAGAPPIEAASSIFLRAMRS